MITNATTGQTSTKTYYLASIFSADWITGYNFCKDNGMTLVTFTSLAEATNFIALCNKNVNAFIFGLRFLVGAVQPLLTKATATSTWYWFDSDDSVNFAIPWSASEPTGTENCLAISPGGKKKVLGFSDVACYGDAHSLVCQDVK